MLTFAGMLQLRDLKKSFGTHPIFSIDNLELKPGIYWLKGVNGSGKSTFMNILAGLLPFHGEILLNGTLDIRRHAVEYRRIVNHAAAEPVFPSFLNGTEIVDFVQKIKGGSTSQREQIQDCLGIDQYIRNPTGSYSSGMLKKLALLLAFTGQPSWVLLDEPFTTLDHASQSQLCGLITQHHTYGVSFILTSHHDIDRSQLSISKVFMLNNHRLETPETA
jgi:ABC-2 type transport system ATP-binding protein